VSRDRLELTVTITDPYVHETLGGARQVPLQLMPERFRNIREMLCSASETAEYNRLPWRPVTEGKKP